MIKAIIFDCYGVLTTEGWLPFKESHFGHDPALMQEASDLAARVNTGHMAYDQFVSEIAVLANVSIETVRRDTETHVANISLFSYIKGQLQDAYKLGLLSNAGSDMLEQLFTHDQTDLFNTIHLSFRTGLAKPDPQAYIHIAEALSVPLEDCLFIDDQERYCTAAQQTGMQAIHYTGLDSFKEAIMLLLPA